MGCACGTKKDGKVSGCNNNGACGTGGCNKMYVFDWLSNMDMPVKDKFDVKLYPNPTPGDFNIQVITSSPEPIRARILDLTGVEIQASTQVSKQGLIGLARKLPGGTYFVEVTQGKNRQVLKLIRTN